MNALALLAALAVGAAHSPAGPIGCSSVTPVLAIAPGPVVAGNFRDSLGGCYVWLNLARFRWGARSACKLAMHEAGHLAGLRHSPNPRSVMYSPFRVAPVPLACRHPE